MDHLLHRKTNACLLLRSASGDPLADARVTVEQIDHAFGFGNIGFEFVDWIAGPPAGVERSNHQPAPDMDTLSKLWLELFNQATLPFYWRQFEPTPGSTDTERLLATALWFRQRGVRPKGHPLLWHTLAPKWLLDLDDVGVEAAIRERITRDVTAFAGLVDHWDAINEVVILPVFTAEQNAVTRLAQKLGRVAMVRLAFEAARDANPNARLVVNDFELTQDYVDLIRDCLQAGIEIDAIGLQTHMHQGFRGAEEIHERIERFAQFGIPIQLTETTLVSGDLMPAHIVDLNDFEVDDWPTTPEGEARQADDLVQHYTTAFAHPAVESITYWGITDHGAWLGAPCGLLRRDGSPKPGYDALRNLIKGDWWYGSRELITDFDGRVRVDSFAGRYRITAADGMAEVELPAGFQGEVVVPIGTGQVLSRR
ncbi:endo-1,4-beta-xylanase [Tessaracoccus sp. OS52]|uniref:endo-1,4-beta-xylanase n=1 Tax=Tessaracoccus sp. OS52 TaxID=2886691 RepID=UPI001D104335|nr:endo-1,4-beta-xylanase [Tessaracoccus sp. OS52]MCC2592886.1 endo-1,4-beta-xylanase [Tessaracoccus sp. OS52]